MLTFRSSSGSKSGNKLGMGCLILFATPFAGFGVFALGKAVQSLTRGEFKDVLFMLLFGLVFSGVGFGLMVAAVAGFRISKRVDALKAAHPDEPWLWREDWANGKIASSNRPLMYFTWVFAAVWNGISLTIFFSVLAKHESLTPIWFVLPFLLVGAGLLTWAILSTLRWKKFGQSWFKLLNNTGVVGGQLTGAIETSVKIQPSEGFHLHLRCIRRDSRGDNTSETILWEDEKVIIKDLLDDPRRSGVAVFFQIPADCEPTDDKQTNLNTIWRLEMSAKLPGPDYLAQFEVPVFRTAASATATTNVSDPTLAYQAPSKPFERAADSPIRVQLLADGSTEFFFPAFRNKSAAFTLLAIFTIWTGGIWFMIVKHAPIGFPIVFGLFDVLLLFVLVSMIFLSFRVIVDAQGLKAQRDWMLFRRLKSFDRADLEVIRTKIGMTANNKVYYDLKAVTRAGSDSTLASAIPEKREAEWLAAEMNRLLKLDKFATPNNMLS